ncbi:WG repeat-containing protein [Campylobacter coli]|uniref:WG repeat-containing protein n=2 Tax=Campylobacter coli TaxID=195 RepID=UPI0009320085|nr:WG repeat-containing protein [Campylobacter coli]
MRKLQILITLFLALFLGACSKMSEIDKLKETCDLEEVQACEKLTQIYQKDCDNNNSQSCFELGKLYENPAIRDLNKAKAYFVKADSLGLEKAKTYISFIDYGFAPATFLHKFGYETHKTFKGGGFIDHTGKWAIEPQFSDIYPFENGFARVVDRDYNIGLINQEGEVIVKPKFDGMGSFVEGLALVLKLKNDKEKYGFINKSGKVVIDLEFDDAYNFSEGLAAVRKDKKWGFINKKGKWAIEAKFDDVFSFSDKTTAFKLSDKWGIIDKQGKIIIEPQLEREDVANKLIYKFKVNDKFGIMDENGKVIVEPTMDIIIVNKYSYCATFCLKDKCGFVNTSDNIFIEPKFDNLFFWDDIASFKLGDKWGLMDNKGNIIAQSKFDHLDSFSEGLAAIRIGDKWGYINKKGEVIEAQFNKVEEFKGGLAAVKKGEKWGFINKKGDWVIKPQFFKSKLDFGRIRFINAFARVRLDKNNYLENTWINKKGEVIKGYEPVESEFGLTKVKMLDGSGFGVVDTNGNFVLKPIYSEISLRPNGFIKMTTEHETCGLVNTERKLFIEPIFDDISVDDFLDDKKLIRFIANGSYGFMDQKGNIIIKEKFTKAGPFSNF